MFTKSKFYITASLVFGLGFSLHSQSLEPMDDESLAQVVGQSRGLNIKTEQNIDIGSVTYTDADGVNGGTSGQLSLSNVKIRTTPSKPMDMDLELKDYNGKKAIWLTARSLSTSMNVGSVAINGKSLGGFGQSAITMGANDSVVIRLYPGGNVGSGLTLDVVLPTSVTFDSHYIDDGTKLTQTVVLKDPNSTNSTLSLEGITLDVENDGMRVGLPEITNGYLAMQNMKIKDSVFGSSVLRKINFKPGAYLMFKNAKEENEQGLELDATLIKNSSFELASITGEITNNTPTVNNFETNAKITLLENLDVRGLRMNVDGQRGLVFDFLGNGGNGHMRVKAEIKDIYFRTADATGKIAQSSLGRAVVDMNLGSQTYLQIQGH